MKKKNMIPAALGALVSGEYENFKSASTPGGIEKQEKQGQIDQSFAETLPIQGTANCRPVWEKLGFVFGEPADDIFVNVKFPEGWRKSCTDHSMWSNLLDDKGQKRAGIFYKAAFYDRSAHVGFDRRYGYETYVDCGGGRLATIVTDAGKEIHRIGDRPETDYAQSEVLRKEAMAWLTENFPQWEDAQAYWIEEESK